MERRDTSCERLSLGGYTPLKNVCRDLGITRDYIFKEFEQGTLDIFVWGDTTGFHCSNVQINARFQIISKAQYRMFAPLVAEDGALLIDEQGYIPWSIALQLTNLNKIQLRGYIRDRTFRAIPKNKGERPQRFKWWLFWLDVRSWMMRHATHLVQVGLAKISAPTRQKGIRKQSAKANCGKRSHSAQSMTTHKSGHISQPRRGMRLLNEKTEGSKDIDHTLVTIGTEGKIIDGEKAEVTTDDLTLSRPPDASSTTSEINDLTLCVIGLSSEIEVLPIWRKAYEDTMYIEWIHSEARLKMVQSYNQILSAFDGRSMAFIASGLIRPS